MSRALLFTALGSALTFSRHRNPGPLILTIATGLWIYAFTFVVGASSHAAAAQVWDVLRMRTGRRYRGAAA